MGFSPEKKPLSPALFAEFPYNIETSFRAREENDWTFVLSMAQEDAWENEKFTRELFDYLRQAYLPCDVKVLFTACDRPRISGNENMSGSEIYCKGVEGAQNIAALVVNFGAKKNFVTPGSGKNISPYYLTRHLCDSLDKNSCSYQISGGTFLALYRLGALKNSARLSAFLSRNIPAVALTLVSGGGQDDQAEAGANAIMDFISGIEPEKCAEWSRHYIPLKFLSRRHWLTESGILFCVFVFTTIALFVLADFAFLFRKRSRRLAKIKTRALVSNYLIFVTAALLTASFFLGEYAALGFENLGVRNLMVLFVIKLYPAFFVVSLIYPLELFRHKTISTYLYEYIISTSSILNIFIWTSIDVSFFFLFALEYLVLTISRVFKKSVFLFGFMALFILPFLPLLYAILVYSSRQNAHDLVFCGLSGNVLLAFLLVPFNLLWLRVLARMNIKASTKRNLIVRYAAAGFCAIAFLTAASAITIHIMGRIFFKNVVLERRMARVEDAAENVMSTVSVYDSEYYGGIIRRVEINCASEPERTEVYVNGSAANPVYFSAYETESIGRISKFLLPDKPPKKFSLQYTPDSSDSEIVVMNYFLQDSGDRCRRESYSFEAAGGKISERRKIK